MATKNRYPAEDYEFEIAEVLQNAPNYPGGANFVKKANKKRRLAVEDTDSD